MWKLVEKKPEGLCIHQSNWELVDYRLYQKDSIFLIPKWGEPEQIKRFRDLESAGHGWLVTKRTEEAHPYGAMIKEELLWRPSSRFAAASAR